MSIEAGQKHVEEPTIKHTGSLPPLSLPPAPLSLTVDQIKRRHIVASLVQSENNYTASLTRLVQEYKVGGNMSEVTQCNVCVQVPLEESSPPILSQAKVELLFHGVEQILQCHTQLRAALATPVQNWDQQERIGDVFVSSFSKSLVMEVRPNFSGPTADTKLYFTLFTGLLRLHQQLQCRDGAG